MFAVTADVASQSRVKSGRRQQEIGPQERDGISSLGGAPRKHGPRAAVVDIPTHWAHKRRGHTPSTRTALPCTLSPRPYARCVAADWPLRITNSTTGASRNWSPDGTNSEALQWSAPPDDLVQQATGVERGPDKEYTTHWYRPAAPRHLTGARVALLFRSTS